MEKSVAQKLRLGIFVILGTIIFILAVYFIGNRQQFFGKTETLQAHFENVNGLQEGNNVRFCGINVGYVKKIEIINDTLINVEMNIDKSAMKFIKNNSIASITSDGLVGNMIVNITPSSENAALAKSGDILKAEERLTTEDLLKTLNKTNNNAEQITTNILEVSKKINNGTGTLSMLLNDKTLSQDVKYGISDLKNSIANIKKTSYETTRTINEVNKILAGINDKENIVAVLKDSAMANKMRRALTHLDESSQNINQTVVNLNETISNAKNGKGAINYLSNDANLVKNIDSTMNNLNQASVLLNQNLEALKHNIFFRGYFKKLEKEKQKAQKGQK
ncbi:MlaD family protein [Cloacibacterium sp. TD35]|uniref:MlaD family protein n=1 Tax=Cloacibacterium sp. TD35 TaxID=2976818 RepID=UPI00237DFD42|nr:MlaD family protein [Cloacibacterium sp. TD35]WDT66960.1 MlaD family protein [Cloacibacterium sp. TD35]